MWHHDGLHSVGHRTCRAVAIVFYNTNITRRTPAMVLVEKLVWAAQDKNITVAIVAVMFACGSVCGRLKGAERSQY